ncbi:hypothetical protein BJX64DRAFT_163746 [Aspergillus heterothallicus]
MHWPERGITCDGFTSEYGRFLAPGRIERVDGASLRRMFLSRIWREGEKQLRDHRDFIRGQLQHYGVPYKESELTGKGTTLLKKALEAGQCDTVPEHIWMKIRGIWRKMDGTVTRMSIKGMKGRQAPKEDYTLGKLASQRRPRRGDPRLMGIGSS